MSCDATGAPLPLLPCVVDVQAHVYVDVVAVVHEDRHTHKPHDEDDNNNNSAKADEEGEDNKDGDGSTRHDDKVRVVTSGQARVQLCDARTDDTAAVAAPSSLQLLVMLSAQHTITRVDVHTTCTRHTRQGDDDTATSRVADGSVCCRYSGTHEHMPYTLQPHTGRVCFAAASAATVDKDDATRRGAQRGDEAERGDAATAAVVAATAAADGDDDVVAHATTLQLDTAFATATMTSVDVAALTMSLAPAPSTPLCSGSSGDGHNVEENSDKVVDVGDRDANACDGKVSLHECMTRRNSDSDKDNDKDNDNEDATAATAAGDVLTLVFDSEPTSVLPSPALSSSLLPPTLVHASTTHTTAVDDNNNNTSDNSDKLHHMSPPPPPPPRRVLRLFRPRTPSPVRQHEQHEQRHGDTDAVDDAAMSTTDDTTQPVATTRPVAACAAAAATASMTTVSAVPVGTVVVCETTANELRCMHDVVPCVLDVELRALSAHDECGDGCVCVVDACTLHYAPQAAQQPQQQQEQQERSRSRRRHDSATYAVVCGGNGVASVSLCPHVARLLAAVDVQQGSNHTLAQDSSTTAARAAAAAADVAECVKREADSDDNDVAARAPPPPGATMTATPLFAHYPREPVVHTCTGAAAAATATQAAGDDDEDAMAACRIDVLLLSTLPTRLSRMRAVALLSSSSLSLSASLLQHTHKEEQQRASRLQTCPSVWQHSASCVEVCVPVTRLSSPRRLHPQPRHGVSMLRYIFVDCDVAMVCSLHALLLRVMHAYTHAMHADGNSNNSGGGSSSRSDTAEMASVQQTCDTVVVFVVPHATPRMSAQRGVDVTDNVVLCAADTVRAACSSRCSSSRDEVVTVQRLRACVTLATALCTRLLRCDVLCACATTSADATLHDNNNNMTCSVDGDDDDDDAGAASLTTALAHAFALTHAACWLPCAAPHAHSSNNDDDVLVHDTQAELLCEERAVLHNIATQLLCRHDDSSNNSRDSRGRHARWAHALARYAMQLHTTLWLLSNTFVRTQLSASCAAISSSAWRRAGGGGAAAAGALWRVVCLVHTLVRPLCAHAHGDASHARSLHASYALQHRLLYDTACSVFDVCALRRMCRRASTRRQSLQSRLYFVGAVSVDVRSVASCATTQTRRTRTTVHVLPPSSHTSWSLDVALQWRSLQQQQQHSATRQQHAHDDDDDDDLVTGAVVSLPLLLFVLTLSPRHAIHKSGSDDDDDDNDSGGDAMAAVQLSSAATFTWQLSAPACVRGHAQHTTFSVVRAHTLHNDDGGNDGGKDTADATLPLHILSATPHPLQSDKGDSHGGGRTRRRLRRTAAAAATAADTRKRSRSPMPPPSSLHTQQYDGDNKDSEEGEGDAVPQQQQQQLVHDALRVVRPLPRVRVLLPLIVCGDTAPLVEAVSRYDDTLWRTLLAHAMYAHGDDDDKQGGGSSGSSADDDAVVRQCAMRWAAAVLRHLAAHCIAAVLASTSDADTDDDDAVAVTTHSRRRRQHVPLLLRNNAAVRRGYRTLLNTLLRDVLLHRDDGDNNKSNNNSASEGWRREAVWMALLLNTASLTACVRAALLCDGAVCATTRAVAMLGDVRVYEVLYGHVLTRDVAAALRRCHVQLSTSPLSSSSSAAARTRAVSAVVCGGGGGADVCNGTAHEQQRARDAIAAVRCRAANVYDTLSSWPWRVSALQQ